MEEAAFMSPELFFQVVVPLLGVKNTALLAISTPQGTLNYYTTLMGLKDQWGEALFLCIVLGLICKSCAKTGEACNHLLSMNPHWKPAERTAKVDAVMAGNPELRDRETRGCVATTMRYIVSESTIEALKTREYFDFPDGKPDVLYSAIDPSGGGAGSDYAIVTMALYQGRSVVIGIDKTGSADPIVVQQMIDGHYRALRAHPRYKKCHIRVFIESNMSFIDAGRIANQLQHIGYGSIEVVSQDASKQQRFGIWTSKDSKEGYAIEIQRSVPTMTRAEHFISDHPTVDWLELLKQLGSFRREVVAPATDTGVALHYKVSLTGKSAGCKDDLVMALGIALYHMMRSQNDYVFLDLCEARGITPS